MSRATDLERETRAISDRLAGGEPLMQVLPDIRHIADRLCKPGHHLDVTPYGAFTRSPTGRSTTWLWSERPTEERDTRAARIRRDIIEDGFCAVIYQGDPRLGREGSGWDSSHGNPLRPNANAYIDSDGYAVGWPQTWRDVEKYLAGLDLADNRVTHIETLGTWWRRTFEDDYTIPGGHGINDTEPATLADYQRARDTITGNTPAERDALTTARYLDESAHREGLPWLLARRTHHA